MGKNNEQTATQTDVAEESNDDRTLDEMLKNSPRLIWTTLTLPRVFRADKHLERLMVVFSEPIQGCLKIQGENTICFHRPGMDFYLPWIKDFKQIVLVHEDDFEEILTMIELLHKIGENKEFFRDKLFLLIPRGRQPICERPGYELREDEFIPIDVDELDRLPKLPDASVDPATIPLTPYAPDCFPLFTNLRSWVAALLKNVLTGLMRNQLFPQLRNGLLETQRLMIQEGKAYIGGLGVAFERSAVVFSSTKGLFRRCIVSRNGTSRIPRKSGDNCFSALRDAPPGIRWWFGDHNRINELGRNLMPHPDSKRPAIMPHEEWVAKNWRFHLDERRPLFPLLLWEGHHAKALSLECFIPPYNFRELIGAMKDVLANLPTPELFPDIEGEPWVDVSDFRDGLGTITLEPLCVGCRSEKRGSLRDFYVALASQHALDELLFGMDEPCGNTYRCPDGNLKIHPTTQMEQEYVAKFLEKAVKPRIMQVRQILWDGSGYRQFSTGELMRYYADSIAESFDGNCECAIRYLDMLNEKYGRHFRRQTRIIRHR